MTSDKQLKKQTDIKRENHLHIFQRTEQLIGAEGVACLQTKRVAIFGLGGVGSYVFEALIRSGIGGLLLIDKDVVDVTNINRQLFALQSTVGQTKVSVGLERGREINPHCYLEGHVLCYEEMTKDELDFSKVDYIVDAMDMVTAKLLLISEAKKRKIPIISCMGTGNRLSAAGFKITDISKTQMCPLAKTMRYELKKRGISQVKVLYSEEAPTIKKQVPASISFVPPVAGMLLAGEVVRDLLAVVDKPLDNVEKGLRKKGNRNG